MANALILRPLPLAAVTASSTADGHSAALVAEDRLGLVWKSAASGSTQSLLIDLGADTAFDSIALFGLTGAQAGWTMKLEAATAAQGSSFPGGSWTGTAASLLAGSVMPVSGRGKALWLAPTSSPPPPSRWVRLTFGNLSGAAVTVGRVVLGAAVRLTRNFQFGAAHGVRDLGRLEFSRRGVMLRARGEKQRSVGISFRHAHRDEVEGRIHPLIEAVGGTEPIALVIDPAANDQRQNRMYFGPLVGDLGTIWARADGFEWAVNLVALDR